MNPLYNKNQSIQRPQGINIKQLHNDVINYVKQELAKGINPQTIRQQILAQYPQLETIRQQYGNMSFQQIAEQNGYNVMQDVSKLGY